LVDYYFSNSFYLSLAFITILRRDLESIIKEKQREQGKLRDLWVKSQD
jgi:hypothetical protein